MKKLVIALAAAAAFSAPAFAADMAAKAPRVAAAPVAYAPSWTGCYIGAGGGGAYSNNDHNSYITGTNVPFNLNTTTGARGWFGTVGAGCDYQVDRWVFGVFGDYDFMDVKGDHSVLSTFAGSQKQDWQWAVGGRIGYVVLPQLLGYVSGGYTQGHWKGTNYNLLGVPGSIVSTPGFTKSGWFIGAGDEYALGFLPGLFWKTEYRYSEFDRANLSINDFATGLPTGFSESNKIREHSVRSELVYRFNWGGPVVAKY